jgi:hypothetical protein
MDLHDTTLLTGNSTKQWAAARHLLVPIRPQLQKGAQLASFGLSPNHSVRFPDSASFVASVFQAFIGDFRPKLLQFRCRRLVGVFFGIIGRPRHLSVSH